MARKKKDQDAKLTDRFKVWMTVSDFAGAVEPRGRKEQDIAALCLPPGSRHSLHSAPVRCACRDEKKGRRFAAPFARSPRKTAGLRPRLAPFFHPATAAPALIAAGPGWKTKSRSDILLFGPLTPPSPRPPCGRGRGFPGGRF